VHQKPDSSVKFIRPCSEPVGKNPNPRNRSAGATSISSFPLLMEPIVVAVGCGAAGAASDLKINPPRLLRLKKGSGNIAFSKSFKATKSSLQPTKERSEERFPSSYSFCLHRSLASLSSGAMVNQQEVEVGVRTNQRREGKYGDSLCVSLLSKTPH
jgi:hypothetical protein